MDPNNLQQNTQPIQQPINNPLQQEPVAQPSQPVPPTAPASPEPPVPPVTPTITPSAPPQTPKGGSKKGILLLIILIILILGMGYYVLFAKKQLNKAPVNNATTAIPTATIAPTAAPETIESIDVSSPDADLNAIEQDLQGL